MASFVGARPAAAEAVGEVGEAVLVQRAGQQDLGRDREHRGQHRRQAEPAGEREGEAAERADQRPDQREGRRARGQRVVRPGRAGAHRQPGQELERRLALVERLAQHRRLSSQDPRPDERHDVRAPDLQL